MRSLGYSAEAFPSAADFLASPRLSETACLIADVHMPAMTGVELYRHQSTPPHRRTPLYQLQLHHDDRDWRFTKDGKSATARPSGSLRVNNGDAMMPALIAGVGLGILPEFILRDALAAGRSGDVLHHHFPDIVAFAVQHCPGAASQTSRHFSGFVSRSRA